jgi:hypothetical protein
VVALFLSALDSVHLATQFRDVPFQFPIRGLQKRDFRLKFLLLVLDLGDLRPKPRDL